MFDFGSIGVFFSTFSVCIVHNTYGFVYFELRQFQYL